MVSLAAFLFVAWVAIKLFLFVLELLDNATHGDGAIAMLILAVAVVGVLWWLL